MGGTSVPRAEPEVRLDDLDGDRRVDGGDLTIAIQEWSSKGDSSVDADDDQRMSGR